MNAAAATWRFLGAAMILTAVIAQGVTTVGSFSQHPRRPLSLAAQRRGDSPEDRLTGWRAASVR